jgi:hypothetical protein
MTISDMSHMYKCRIYRQDIFPGFRKNNSDFAIAMSKMKEACNSPTDLEPTNKLGFFYRVYTGYVGYIKVYISNIRFKYEHLEIDKLKHLWQWRIQTFLKRGGGAPEVVPIPRNSKKITYFESQILSVTNIRW